MAEFVRSALYPWTPSGGSKTTVPIGCKQHHEASERTRTVADVEEDRGAAAFAVGRTHTVACALG